MKKVEKMVALGGGKKHVYYMDNNLPSWNVWLDKRGTHVLVFTATSY